MRRTTLLAGIAACILFSVPAFGAHFRTLYSFTGGNDGSGPEAALARDRDGNLYGTAAGGANGLGVVFRLAPDGTQTVLHAFAGGSDVGNPNSNLVRDGAGSLYGAAMWGGNGNDGGVFRIAPDGTETVLYSATPGANTPAGLAADRDGNLYTAVQGGKHGHGAILRIAPDGKMSVVYAFRGGRDGDTSLSGVIVDAANNLYGTTPYGGGDGCSGGLGCGTVFRIAADGQETVLHRFKDGDDGSAPFGGLLMDRRGHLYGAAYSGGTHGQGTVFEIDP